MVEGSRIGNAVHPERSRHLFVDVDGEDVPDRQFDQNAMGFDPALGRFTVAIAVLKAHADLSAETALEAIEIGTKLVALCNTGKSVEAMETLYDEKIVSIEGQGSEEMPARLEGIEAIRGKTAWWFDHHEVHSEKATGPFCGWRDDQFAVQFEMDITNKPSGQQTQMTEVSLYTVANGKVVQEEFLYLMA